MSNQFKAGDLALIIRCSYEQNVGKCVELVELVPPGGIYKTSNGLVKNMAPVNVWHVVGAGVQGSSGAGHVQKFERNLMPLRGDYAPESSRREELTA